MRVWQNVNISRFSFFVIIHFYVRSPVVPGQPGKPECVDADKDHIKIKWTAPISNGGSKIIGYDVERRDRATGRWIKQNKEPVKYPEYYDDHVTEGHQYEYRVSAINAAGAGKPSDTSSVFTAKPMKEKPKLHLDALIGRKIKVRAGEPINVNIPLSGAPTPKIEWTKDGRSLMETLRLSVCKTSYTCVFKIFIFLKFIYYKYFIIHLIILFLFSRFYYVFRLKPRATERNC